MKYSYVDRIRVEAQPGLQGQCIFCGQATIAKCGKIKIWHWAHKGKRVCDQWWENETPWHRSWKNHFPVEWQECIHIAENDEKHIADVKTIKGWVIEFQHSYINPDERQARSDFYGKLVWVVDAARRKRDKSKFFESLIKVAALSNPQSLFRGIFKVLSDDCALFKDWFSCPAPVFFDFGQDEPTLWCLLPQTANGTAYIVEFLRAGFIALHQDEVTENDYFSDIIKNLRTTVEEQSLLPPAQNQNSLLQQRSQYYRRRRFIRM